jgi:nucleoside-diphosphate-sugar epimerase
MSSTSTVDVAGRPKRVAVLGGTGFVGRPLCAAMAALGHEVVAFARRPAPVDGAAAVIALDLAAAEAAELAAVLTRENVSVVVNAAGGMWGLTDEQMVDANVTLTERVIDAVASVPGRPRLVQLGSIHEYGLVPIGESMDEELGPQPVNAYSRLKLQCTEAVLEASAQGRIDGVVLRIGNIIGAGQPPVSLLGVVAEQLASAYHEGRPATLTLGPLASQRDFLCLSDALSAIIRVATMPELPARLFNIGTGHANSARTMVQLLIEVTGVQTQLVEAEPTGGPELTWQQMSVDRARELLGWWPGGDLSDGMKELWEHQVESARS